MSDKAKIHYTSFPVASPQQVRSFPSLDGEAASPSREVTEKRV